MTELDVEALVLRHLQNVTQVSDGKKHYSGYVDGEEEYLSFLTDMKALGFSFYSRTSTTNKSSRILFTCEKRNADINIPYFGSPFQIVKSIYMMCSKDGRYIPSVSKLTALDPLRKTRTSKQPSKKVGCAAFMSVKCLRVFNQERYRLDSPYKRICAKKKKILATLSKDLSSPRPPAGTLRFMIIMSPAGDHNHSVVSTNLKQILHPRLREEIHDYVRNNVSTVQTIKAHLGEVVRGMFEDGDRPQPDPLNRCYYPTDHVIRFHMHQGLCAISKSWYDQEALEGSVRVWEGEHPDDSFFFRPYDGGGGTTLLFCHQTAWQRGLLRRYGDRVTTLDPTHRTCRYAFPLYFLVVATNAGPCVVATLVVQVGSGEALAEGLRRIRAWNPDWEPGHVTVDNVRAEISAVETCFPRATVHIGVYHRELAWDRWLGKKGHVAREAVAPVRELWQAIAASRTDAEYRENLRLAFDGEPCEAARKYLSDVWLPVHAMWVEAFQTKEFLFNVKINDGLACQRSFLRHVSLAGSKEKSLTGVVTFVLESLLPDAWDKYSASNPSAEYVLYDESVPEFLKDRPLPFVERVMLGLEEGGGLEASHVNALGDGLFAVRAEPGSEDWCSVDFRDAACSCADFDRWRLPCRHMCAVFLRTAWGFDRLPGWYTGCPYVTSDPLGGEEGVDLEAVWRESRDKLGAILGYTHLHYSAENALRFAGTISTLEEEMLSCAEVPPPCGPPEPNLSVQMKRMKTLKHVKRKYLDIPQCSRPKLRNSEKYIGQYDIMSNDWHQYTTENGDSIDQIVIIDMM